jgi:hypothetical protein
VAGIRRPLESKLLENRMKTWTVVIEIQDGSDLNQKEIESMVEMGMEHSILAGSGFQIMETIEAPYGPTGAKKKDGVYIFER